MNIGKHIRENRLRCNLTQERLAEKLGVTAQAVSKWESGATMPDITLLPELAALFGITIDALFETTEEQLLDRIEAMQEQRTMLSRADFDYAMARLEDLRHSPAYRARCLTLMGELCLHRSQGYAKRAQSYARQALELDAACREDHLLLFKTHGPSIGDWCCCNHTELIDYYTRFVMEHLDYLPGYMWLADYLIADGRMEEARSVVERMGNVRRTYHYPMYLAMLAQRDGQFQQAQAHWQEMLDAYGGDANAWFVYGDALAKATRYREAIAAFEKASELASPPRYIDAQDSIAQLCLLLNDRDGAARAWRTALNILRDEWQITEGETVDDYVQKMSQFEK